jgi:hypothetical protein
MKFTNLMMLAVVVSA